MKYNTQNERLNLPEYGRNIQNMVDHCITLEDREERKKCADAVVEVMGNMFPHLRDVNDFKHILWDHIAIMSDFKLDIDYPYEVITKEELYTAPDKLEYSRPTMKYRHYGKILEKMIAIASEMEEGEEKKQLISQITAQMKKSYIEWNKDVDDQKIIEDLRELSKGKIALDIDSYTIANIKDSRGPAPKRRTRVVRGQRRR